MKVIITPSDNRVAIDGVWKTVDVSGFPHINCARLEGEAGSIEHCEHDGKWLKPRTLTEGEFKDEFRSILAAWEEALTDEEIIARNKPKEPDPPPAYVPTKADYLAAHENNAAITRSRYVTVAPGMDLVYQEKAAEAVAVVGMGREAANALPDHGTAEFPMLAASVGIEAETLFDIAEIVSEKAEAFASIAGGIERIRLAGKKAISSAETDEEAKAAFESITWP